MGREGRGGERGEGEEGKGKGRETPNDLLK